MPVMDEETIYQRLRTAWHSQTYIIAKGAGGWKVLIDDAGPRADELGPFKTRKEAEAAGLENLHRMLAKAVAGA